MELKDFENEIVVIDQKIDNSSFCCFIYPGQGYYLNSPLFYYLFPVLEKLAIDYFGFDFRYADKQSLKGISDDIFLKSIAQDSYNVYNEISKITHNYKKKIHICKSLGTFHVKYGLANNKISKNDLLIWLTPPEDIFNFLNYLLTLENKSLVIFGTKDKNYTDKCKVIKNTDLVTIISIENAKHGFEIDNDIYQSIENLKIVISYVENYLQQNCEENH